ncbi:MAG: YcaO-like family protein [Halobaculum sp.]
MNWTPDDGVVPATYRRLVGRRTGVVRRVSQTAGDRTDPGVLGSSVTFADPDAVPGITASDAIQAGGKGRTLRSATLSGLGEAAERYAMYHVPPRDAFRDATADELPATIAADALTARLTGLFDLTVRGDGKRRVTPDDRGFDPDQSRPWAAGRNLHTGETVYVPAGLTGPVSRRFDPPTRWPFTSNGIAAGRTITDALVNALFELIERDAVMTAWWDGSEPPGVTVSPPRALREAVETPGYEIRTFAPESPIDLPVVGAATVSTADEFPAVHFAASAAFGVTDALTDALVELGQSFPRYVTAEWWSAVEADPTEPAESFTETGALYGRPDVADAAARFADPVENGHPLADHPQRVDIPSRTALDRLLDRLADADCTPIAVELTPPGLRQAGIDVVRVFVPELTPLTLPSHCPRDHPRLADRSVVELPHPFP